MTPRSTSPNNDCLARSRLHYVSTTFSRFTSHVQHSTYILQLLGVGLASTKSIIIRDIPRWAC